MSQIQLFDYSVNLLRALLWQFNDATRLQSLLEQKQEWNNQNQRDFWSDWYTNVFNLQTANEFGLSVWAIILQLPIVVQTNPVTPSRPTWGFEEFHRNFNRGNFFSGRGGADVLTPENARLALRLRYYQLTTRATVPEINHVLQLVFGELGEAYVEDNLDMTMTYNFAFDINAQLFSVINKYDLLLRPSGVGITGINIYDLVYDGPDMVYDGAYQVIDEP